MVIISPVGFRTAQFFVTGTRITLVFGWVDGFQTVNVNRSCPSMGKHSLIFVSWHRNWVGIFVVALSLGNSFLYASLMTNYRKKKWVTGKSIIFEYLR